MAFDGIVTKAIVTELSELTGARIDKVFEPNKNEIILGLYSEKKNYALDICIESQNCRINLTTNAKPNPQVAPNFCMLLRKNLIGLKLKNLITFDLERLIVLEFEGFDDVDDIISKKLIVELMGKHSNIILLDDNNIIIDSMRHIRELDENFRDILPHTKYSFPTSNKKSFLELRDFEEFSNCINGTNIEDLPLQISNTFNGISKNFISAMLDINYPSIVVFEDVDAMNTKINRKTLPNKPQQNKKIDVDCVQIVEAEEEEFYVGNGGVSISAILNVFDGIYSQEGQLIFATTNYQDQLDPAFVRAGRFNTKVEFGYMSRYEICLKLKTYYKGETSEIALMYEDSQLFSAV